MAAAMVAARRNLVMTFPLCSVNASRPRARSGCRVQATLARLDPAVRFVPKTGPRLTDVVSIT